MPRKSNTENNESTECQLPSMQRAVRMSAIGALKALRFTEGTIPEPMLDAVIVLGRTAYETLSNVAPESESREIVPILSGIKAQLDRLDDERVKALAADGKEEG